MSWLHCLCRVLLFLSTLGLFSCRVWASQELPVSAGNSAGKEDMEWGVFLEQVRKKALRFTDDLPNFICRQVTRRYIDALGGNQWQSQDMVEAELSYNQKEEQYSNVKINGRPTVKRFESIGKALSVGEFGSMLRVLFIPETRTKFWKEREEQFGGVPAIVIGFQVPQENSGWTLNYKETHSLKVGYEGKIWADRQNQIVLRISQHTMQLPHNFPILYSETTTEYGYRDIQGIAGNSFLLPVAAEVVIRENQNRFSSRNLIEFRDFRRFTADVKLTAD
jgi:hypothetical protein